MGECARCGSGSLSLDQDDNELVCMHCGERKAMVAVAERPKAKANGNGHGGVSETQSIEKMIFDWIDALVREGMEAAEYTPVVIERIVEHGLAEAALRSRFGYRAVNQFYNNELHVFRAHAGYGEPKGASSVPEHAELLNESDAGGGRPVAPKRTPTDDAILLHDPRALMYAHFPIDGKMVLLCDMTEGMCAEMERRTRNMARNYDHKANGWATLRDTLARVVCFQIGEALIKQNWTEKERVVTNGRVSYRGVTPGRYRAEYDRSKAEYLARVRRGPSECPFGQTHKDGTGRVVKCGDMHIHNAARRSAVKLLLEDLWNEWRRRQGHGFPDAHTALARSEAA